MARRSIKRYTLFSRMENWQEEVKNRERWKCSLSAAMSLNGSESCWIQQLLKEDDNVFQWSETGKLCNCCNIKRTIVVQTYGRHQNVDRETVLSNSFWRQEKGQDGTIIFTTVPWFCPLVISRWRSPEIQAWHLFCFYSWHSDGRWDRMINCFLLA